MEPAGGLCRRLSLDGEYWPRRCYTVLDVLQEPALQAADVTTVDVPGKREVPPTPGAPFQE